MRTALFRLRSRASALPNTWQWAVVIVPFLATRLAWVTAALFARGSLPVNPSYAQYAERGYFLSRFFLIDMWTHWDGRWYFSIAKHGYTPPAGLSASYSNLAFFPLYPSLARFTGWFGLPLPDSALLLWGVLLSNLFFLASAVLLYQLAVHRLGFDPSSARRALVLIYAFPSAFFFSSFYPESLFLFLTAAGFWLGLSGRWAGAAVCAALAMVTRPQGVLTALALGWLYMETHGWKLRAIRPDALWFALVPLPLLLHLWHLYRLTGDFLAPLHAQSAWGRGQYGLLQGIWLNLSGPALDVFKIDALLLLLFLACGVYMLIRWPVKAYGLFVVLVCLMPLSTGLLVSVSRFLAAAFPVFLFLGQKLKGGAAYQVLTGVWFALQIIYLAAWVNYYWIA